MGNEDTIAIKPIGFFGAIDNAYYAMSEKRNSLQNDNSEFAIKQKEALSKAMNGLLEVLRFFPAFKTKGEGK